MTRIQAGTVEIHIVTVNGGSCEYSCDYTPEEVKPEQPKKEEPKQEEPKEEVSKVNCLIGMSRSII